MDIFVAKKLKKGDSIYYKKEGVYGVFSGKCFLDKKIKITILDKNKKKIIISVKASDIESSKLADSIIYGNRLEQIKNCFKSNLCDSTKYVLNSIIDHAIDKRKDICLLCGLLKISPEDCFLKLTGYREFSLAEYVMLTDYLNITSLIKAEAI